MENWQSIFSQVERLKRDMEMKPQLFELYYEKQMTLQQIGHTFGVTKERIRQIMERLAMSRYPACRNSKGGYKQTGKPKFETIDEYFKYIKIGGRESHSILLKFVAPTKKHCEECGSVKKLDIHHLKYPATSFDDIQILCHSCHIAEHKKGIGVNTQTKIGHEYLRGKNGVELANEYNVSNGFIYRILRRKGIPRRSRRWSRPLDKNLKYVSI